MNEIIAVNDTNIKIREWNNQRVVTFNDIDRVHGKAEGTAKRTFHKYKQYFTENHDYFIVKPEDFQKYATCTFGVKAKEIPNRGITFITESGYLKITKPISGEKAWQVQCMLVNTYFKFNEVVQNFNSNYPIDTNALNTFLEETKKKLPCVYVQINNIESILKDVVDNMTLSTRQQEKIHEAARKRINYLLGGAHSTEYKQNARSYMINLWNGLKATFHCGSSYKDLNPKDFEKAIDYINHWIYEE